MSYFTTRLDASGWRKKWRDKSLKSTLRESTCELLNVSKSILLPPRFGCVSRWIWVALWGGRLRLHCMSRYNFLVFFFCFFYFRIIVCLRSFVDERLRKIPFCLTSHQEVHWFVIRLRTATLYKDNPNNDELYILRRLVFGLMADAGWRMIKRRSEKAASWKSLPRWGKMLKAIRWAML